jgi:hypothetical protein
MQIVSQSVSNDHEAHRISYVTDSLIFGRYKMAFGHTICARNVRDFGSIFYLLLLIL